MQAVSAMPYMWLALIKAKHEGAQAARSAPESIQHHGSAWTALGHYHRYEQLDHGQRCAVVVWSPGQDAYRTGPGPLLLEQMQLLHDGMVVQQEGQACSPGGAALF